jgi:hypothetical protein
MPSTCIDFIIQNSISQINISRRDAKPQSLDFLILTANVFTHNSQFTLKSHAKPQSLDFLILTTYVFTHNSQFTLKSHAKPQSLDFPILTFSLTTHNSQFTITLIPFTALTPTFGVNNSALFTASFRNQATMAFGRWIPAAWLKG